jgi:hypothetical protein
MGRDPLRRQRQAGLVYIEDARRFEAALAQHQRQCDQHRERGWCAHAVSEVAQTAGADRLMP